MGLLSKAIDKIAGNSVKRDEICDEADAFIGRVQYEFSNSNEFIKLERAQIINDECEDMLKKINSISFLAYVPTSKLNVKKAELKNFSGTIEQKLNDHNDRIASIFAVKARDIIGEVEGRKLDDQQMKCIVKPMENHLVIAGAGTGKTTTIVGKVKYLLNSKICEPKDILVLSFTNASAEEMRTRINAETKAKIEASTFHKLGLNIIAAANEITPKITKIQLQKFVKDQIQVNMNNPRYLTLLCRYFLFNHKYEKTEFDFKTKREYDDYLSTNPPATLKGDKVKSYGEMDIANFLYQNGITYEYEKEYEVDTRTAERFQYYPDFFLTDYGIYIEYWGIDEQGNVPSYFTSTGDQDPSKEYRDSMEWKKKTHTDNHTMLVECFAYERKNGVLLANLEKKLKDLRVEFTPQNPAEIWEQVSAKNGKNVLSGVAELLATIISLIKSNDYSFDRFKQRCRNLRFKNEVAVELTEPIYSAYQEALGRSGEIDFTDMINQATALIKSGKYVNPYKYVIVDEYQDISKARYNLLKALRDSSFYNLFCVGDDWQSIYRFAGSDMDYILNFAKYWGPTEYSKIETTYRFTDSLIDISGNFVMKNPGQIKKNIKGVPSKIGFALGEITGYTEELAIGFMLKTLEELPTNSTVFFIGRYTMDSRLLSNCTLLKCNYDIATGEANVVYSARPDLKMQFITAHKSKGLQADYVFIINNKDRGMGFPSKIQDDPVVDLLLEGKETFPYAEERRLFYVALTRAKIKSYIVVVDNNKSEFTAELEQQYGRKLKQGAFICPLCGGRLERKTGPYGEFYGCSNYRINQCKYKRKIEKGNT